jgi:hypothetical protein
LKFLYGSKRFGLIVNWAMTETGVIQNHTASVNPPAVDTLTGVACLPIHFASHARYDREHRKKRDSGRYSCVFSQQHDSALRLPLPANSSRLAHELRVPDDLYRILLSCITSDKQRKAIDQAPPTPVH